MKRSILKTALSLTIMVVLLITCTELEKEILVTTGEITNIQVNSVEASGSLVDLGEGVNQHGHYYSKSSDPAKDILHTTLGKPEGAGGFISQVESLEAGTKYYIVAYATGNKGNSFGDIKSFTTLPAKIPVLGTNEIIAITTTSATCGGNITDEGGAPVTARGICWGTTTIPTLEGNKTIAGSGTGGFSGSMTGLTPGARYYVRAYATNSAGTGYGPEKSFVTIAAALPVISINSVTDITKITAVSGGNITSDGGMPVMARGVCLNTTGNPTTTDNKTFDGTGTGSFVSNLTGLTQGTKYYLRAYAGNYAGTAYSEEISFTTLADAAKSTIVTSDISETTQTTANSGGNVTSDGGTPVTERGICWNTSGSPTTADNKKTEGSGTGSFVSSLSGLTPNTTYFLRAYAINEAGISYGVEKTFSTNAASLPVITTTQVLNITQTTAVSGGNVTADGGIVVTARGVCWNLTGNPTISDYKTSEGTGTGTFVSNLTELSPGKNYYLRSYAVNNVGTTYGQELTFSTSQPTCAKPTVSSNNATEILATSVTLNGSVNANGFESALVFEYGFGTDYGYTVNASPNSIATNVNTPITFTLTGLLSNTTYHYRVRAVNCGGTEYGNDQSFTTSCENAISLSADASNISNVTAILNGSVDPNNSSTIVIFEYGLTTSYENTKTANQSPVTGMDAVVVSAELIGLIPNTVYHYRIKSTNCAGTITGIDKTFTTLCNPPVCNASSASSITTTAAYLNGSVNGGDFSTIVTFEYGLTSNPYSSSISATPGTVTGASNTQVGVSLTSLTSGTTYHYRVKAVSCGGVVYSPDIQFTTSCIAPVCSTSAATLIQNTTVTLNGTVNPEGCNSTVVFEYGTTTSYGSTITATQSPISTSGSVNANISELLSGTTYHFRVKSTNSGGTTSASDMTFTTTVKDIDGNVYTKVSIGTQVWMVENLKTSHYRNGSSIPNVTDNTAWINMTSGASCIYSNLWDTYGKLYNWYAVNDSRGLCPLGWHVPTDNEWSTLENYLIANSYNYDGTTIGNKYAKAIASSNDWMSSTTIGAVGNTDYPAKRNATGFSALPGGSRNSLGTFLGYGSYTNFWTSTEDYTAAWTRHFGSNQVSVTRGDGGDYKVAGNTVRCLRGD